MVGRGGGGVTYAGIHNQSNSTATQRTSERRSAGGAFGSTGVGTTTLFDGGPCPGTFGSDGARGRRLGPPGMMSSGGWFALGPLLLLNPPVPCVVGVGTPPAPPFGLFGSVGATGNTVPGTFRTGGATPFPRPLIVG